MRLAVATVAALLVAAPAAWADGPARVDATLIMSSGTGRTLSADIWGMVPAVGAFVQREPHEGAEPSQTTEFRVAFDETMLYINVRANDREADKIVTYLTRRDDDSPCDWIRVFIDSYHDRKTAYEFAVNPDGVKQDRYWFNDTNNDKSWDAVWDVSVSRDTIGLVRAVPHSVFAAAVYAGRLEHVWLRRRARNQPAERDLDVAAVGSQRERLCFVVRRAGWTDDGRDAEAFGVDAVCRGGT